jgi:predicted DNA-binding protein (MmcQ/YjbR family)
MDYSEKLLANHPKEEALLSYGFRQEGDFLVYERKASADSSFTFRIRLGKGSFSLDLIDTATKEAYAPFSLEGVHGSYVAAFREEGDALIEDILRHGFESDSYREKLIAYVQEHDHAEITYAWPHQFPRYCTIHEKGKTAWYGLIMNVPFLKLGVDKKGEADILNVKLDPEEIQKLIDHHLYFPAYHMSKKDWISILLSREVPFEEITRLLEESHALSLKKK